MNTEVHFRGPAQVYLEGAGALELVGSPEGNPLTYYVAGRESAILVRDFRPGPRETARGVLTGQKAEINFAQAFSQPAWVEVVTTLGWAEIHLHDCQTVEPPARVGLPTLWLGVAEQDWSAPFGLAEWEYLKTVEDRVAFVALVD